MARKKRLSKDAEQVAVYLTPEEQLAIEVIRGRRKKRGEERTTSNEVVADALWKMLADVEGIAKGQIQRLLYITQSEEEKEKSKLTIFPKTEKS